MNRITQTLFEVIWNGHSRQVPYRCSDPRSSGELHAAPPSARGSHGAKPPGACFPAVSGTSERSGPGDSATEAQVGCKGYLSHLARMVVSLRAFAGSARRVSPHHGVSVCRIQMQSRLLVLL